MEIGKETETTYIEPIREPKVPQEEPVKVEPKRKREKVPV